MRNYVTGALLVVSALTLAAEAMPAVGAAAIATVAGSAATLYVDNQISGTVTPISIATNTPGKPIKAGSGPTTMEITPNGKMIYAVDSGPLLGTVTPISTAANAPGKPIKVGKGAYGAAITPDGKTLYVVNDFAGTVTPITTATNTPGKPIKTGNTPWSIVCAPTVCRSSSTAG